MLRVTGEVVKTDEAPYDVANADGTRNVGISRKVRIEVARGEYVDVKIGDRRAGLMPRDGDLVDWSVVPYNGRNGKDPEINLLGPFTGVSRHGEVIGK